MGGLAWVPSMPVVFREFTSTGRRKWVYAIRLLPMVICCLPMVWFALFFALLPSAMQGRGNLDILSGFMGMALAWVQVLVVALICPLVSAGLIAGERQNGTLGLVLITGLRGSDLFFSKLFVAFVQVELILLSTLPLISFGAYLGGINVPLAALRLASSSVYALAMCALGLMCSSMSRRPGEALALSILLAALWAFVQYMEARILGTTFTGPIYWLFQSAPDRLDLPGWAASFVGSLVVAGLAGLLTIRAIPRLGTSSSPASAQRARRRAPRAASARGSCASLIASAASAVGILSRWSAPARLLAALVLIPVTVFPCGLGSLLAYSLVAYEVTSSFETMRREGALDAILLTPGTNRELAQDFLRVFFRRGLLVYPALVVSRLFYAFALSIGAASASSPSRVLIQTVFSLVNPLIMIYLCVVCACCMATTERSSVVQTALALVRVFVVQLFAGAVGMFVVTAVNLSGNLRPKLPGEMAPIWQLAANLCETGVFLLAIQALQASFASRLKLLRM